MCLTSTRALLSRPRAGLLRVATKIGRAVGRLHDGGVVHGDLTTSNMILRESDDELVRTHSRPLAGRA
jgi:tRNA A-37 threonylcarbamoyl transferase component Bud32